MGDAAACILEDRLPPAGSRVRPRTRHEAERGEDESACTAPIVGGRGQPLSGWRSNPMAP